jgi:hypothetical protein
MRNKSLAFKAAVAAPFVALLTFVSAGVAGATTVADPTGGGATTLTGDITGWITTYGVPMIVSIMVVGLIVTLFIKYGKKGVKSAG